MEWEWAAGKSQATRGSFHGCLLPEHKVASALETWGLLCNSGGHSLPQGHRGEPLRQHPDHRHDASSLCEAFQQHWAPGPPCQRPGHIRSQWHHQTAGYVTRDPPKPPERPLALWHCHQKCPSSLHCTLGPLLPRWTRGRPSLPCPRCLPSVRSWGWEGVNCKPQPGCVPAKASLPSRGQGLQGTIQPAG